MMPRRPRTATGGYAYHVLNRAVARAAIFQKHGDYDAFERVLRQAKNTVPTRLLAYCLMPNHFHLVLWPDQDGELSEFLHWLALTHTMRWHAHYHSSGTGPLYQGRFKSFPVQEDEHLITVCRYVERNPLRAKLVTRAEAWPWSSLARRVQERGLELLDDWPMPIPAGSLQRVNGVETAAELSALRRSVQRGSPFGSESWQQETALRLGLQSTLKPLGRPRKSQTAAVSGLTLFANEPKVLPPVCELLAESLEVLVPVSV
jgi:putative transposase